MHIEIVSSLFRVLGPIKLIRPVFSSIRKGLDPPGRNTILKHRTEVLVRVHNWGAGWR